MALDRGIAGDTAFDYKAMYYYLFNEINVLIEELHMESGAQEQDSLLRFIKALEKIQFDSEEFLLSKNPTEQSTPIHNDGENAENIITLSTRRD